MRCSIHPVLHYNFICGPYIHVVSLYFIPVRFPVLIFAPLRIPNCASCLARTFYSIFLSLRSLLTSPYALVPASPTPTSHKVFQDCWKKERKGGSGGGRQVQIEVCHLSKIGIDTSTILPGTTFQATHKRRSLGYN